MTTNNLTDSELNEFIHIRVMEVHLHDWEISDIANGWVYWTCSCGESEQTVEEEPPIFPNYTGDLNLAAKAEQVAIEKFGINKYGLALLSTTHDADHLQEWSGVITADARERMDAVRNMYLEQKKQQIAAVGSPK